VNRQSESGLSRLAMGTVALGMPYGLSSAEKQGEISKAEAVKLLHSASAMGITLFDTAPGYGVSESIVGEAFANDESVVIATKVDNPSSAATIASSIERSLKRLRRERLDIVQIHNATVDTFTATAAMETLQRLRQQGKVGRVGASVYGEAAAMAAIESGVEVLQVACNLLDQRMLVRVAPAAEQQKVQLMIRSIFLKGVLTPWGSSLKGALEPLYEAANQVVNSLQIEWSELSTVALRFALECSPDAVALVGITNQEELQQAVDGVHSGALSPWQREQIKGLAIDDESLLNPSKWPRDKQLMG
jgi:aryl-alcohol dehydrogenase-like predicted oxidoreductase